MKMYSAVSIADVDQYASHWVTFSCRDKHEAVFKYSHIRCISEMKSL